MFSNCANLESIEIPDGVTSIEEDAFSYCQSLTEIYIPASVTDIFVDFGGAFSGCTSVKEYIVAADNPNYKSVNGILYSKSGDILIRYPSAKTDKSYVTPEGVTNIADGAFFGSAYLESIILPDDLEVIGQSTFYECYKLEEINIPGKLRSIGGDAFRGCISLTSVVIPSSVTSIGSSAFYGCSSLTVLCKSPSKPRGWIIGWVEEDTKVVWNY